MPEPDVQSLTFVAADDAVACDPVTGVCEIPSSGQPAPEDDDGAR